MGSSAASIVAHEKSLSRLLLVGMGGFMAQQAVKALPDSEQAALKSSPSALGSFSKLSAAA
jgi:hypothetical protein